jgi:hypothetical protein
VFTDQHIDHLREQVAKADAVAAGWRDLLTYAQANRGLPTGQPAGSCTCGLPGTPGMVHLVSGQCYAVEQVGRTPYPPLEVESRGAWTPRQEAHFQGFEAAHRELADEQGGTA